MADDEPDDVSPWLDDDWLPNSAVPDMDVFASGRPTRSDAAGRASSVGAHPGRPVDRRPDAAGGNAAAGDRPPSRSSGRRLAVGAVLAIVVITAAVLLLRGGGDGATEATASTLASGSPVANTLTTSGPEPTTPVPSAVPTTVRTLSNTVAPPGPGGFVVMVPPVEIGQPPTWGESTIVVPDRLSAMTPTEVVTLSPSGVLMLSDFPSGRTRSVDVSGMGSIANLAVNQGTIVVAGPRELVLIRDGEPVISSTLSDGVIFVQPWPGTDSFIVTSPRTGPTTAEQDWVLAPDGGLSLLDPALAEVGLGFGRAFAPNGDLLVTQPGGVYAIGGDGTARRISTGDLVATGEHHYAIEECDEALRCAYSVVSWETGEVFRGQLDAVTRYGFVDPATRISPDGRTVLFRDDSAGEGLRGFLDVESGKVAAAGRVNQIVYVDSWAADSSGAFFGDGTLQFIDRENGTTTEIEGAGKVRAVATRAIIAG